LNEERVKCLKRPRLRETDGNVYAAGYTKITRHTCANFNTRQCKDVNAATSYAAAYFAPYFLYQENYISSKLYSRKDRVIRSDIS